MIQFNDIFLILCEQIKKEENHIPTHKIIISK